MTDASNAPQTEPQIPSLTQQDLSDILFLIAKAPITGESALAVASLQMKLKRVIEYSAMPKPPQGLSEFVEHSRAQAGLEGDEMPEEAPAPIAPVEVLAKPAPRKKK